MEESDLPRLAADIYKGAHERDKQVCGSYELLEKGTMIRLTINALVANSISQDS